MNRHPRVLLIEDDSDDILSFRRALPRGVDLVIARDGEEGLAKAREVIPDVIILDLTLPKLPGEEVCKSIRMDEKEEVAKIPIMMLTDKSSDPDRIVGKVIGANRYLTKACETAVLSAEIKRMLDIIEILVIEDDLDDQLLIKAMLSKDKRHLYDIVCVDRLMKGVEHFKSSRPDLILLDLDLPDSHGLETFISLFKMARGVPVLVLTGREDDELAEEAVRNGAQDYVSKKELTGHGLMSAVAHSIERYKLVEEIQRLSLVDELTGLHNRRGFLELAAHQLEVSHRNKKGIFIIYADLDHLKVINDTHGHIYGDQALIRAASVLKTTFRASDIIGRVGGDEFAITVTDCENEGVDKLKKRLRENIEELNARNDYHYPVELSVGVLLVDSDGSIDVNDLLNEADRLMYKDKCAKKSLTPGIFIPRVL